MLCDALACQLCAPWGAALWQLLDATSVPSNRLRRIYNSWGPWGATRIQTIVGVWATAVDDLTGFPPPGYGRVRVRTKAQRGFATRRTPFLLKA